MVVYQRVLDGARVGLISWKQLLFRHSKIRKETETKDKNVTLVSAKLEMSSPRNTLNLKHANNVVYESQRCVTQQTKT